MFIENRRTSFQISEEIFGCLSDREKRTDRSVTPQTEKNVTYMRISLYLINVSRIELIYDQLILNQVCQPEILKSVSLLSRHALCE